MSTMEPCDNTVCTVGFSGQKICSGDKNNFLIYIANSSVMRASLLCSSCHECRNLNQLKVSNKTTDALLLIAEQFLMDIHPVNNAVVGPGKPCSHQQNELAPEFKLVSRSYRLNFCCFQFLLSSTVVLQQVIIEAWHSIAHSMKEEMSSIRSCIGLSLI